LVAFDNHKQTEKPSKKAVALKKSMVGEERKYDKLKKGERGGIMALAHWNGILALAPVRFLFSLFLLLNQSECLSAPPSDDEWSATQFGALFSVHN
jgi:hypothetical protein